ncbi:MAG: SDR family NAD(P)-dependent oxidoreductase [Balneolaceae bacterium]|nr:SDR family NAD(P)-dependent oxidoreductase [Balneolaceae bacterium]
MDEPSGYRLRSTYAASKHALHGWFDCLRQEVFEHNIDVSLVCPGFIKTNVTLNALEGDGSKHGKMGRRTAKRHEAGKVCRKIAPENQERKRGDLHWGHRTGGCIPETTFTQTAEYDFEKI